MKKTYPALALLEFDSIALGIHAVDRMIKKAPVALLKCGTIHPGRYLVLLGGTVASTAEAYDEGAIHAGVVDSILLADVQPQVHDAVFGARQDPGSEALGILETTNSCALLRVADAALKSVSLQLVEIRLADDLGGHALMLIGGTLADVESALDIGCARVGADGQLLSRSVIPRLNADYRHLLGEGTAFRECGLHRPAGAEETEVMDVSR